MGRDQERLHMEVQQQGVVGQFHAIDVLERLFGVLGPARHLGVADLDHGSRQPGDLGLPSAGRQSSQGLQPLDRVDHTLRLTEKDEVLRRLRLHPVREGRHLVEAPDLVGVSKVGRGQQCLDRDAGRHLLLSLLQVDDRFLFGRDAAPPGRGAC